MKMSKLKNGAKSLFTIAKNKAKGIDQSVPQEVADNRLKICNACENLNKIRQCTQCLCFVDLKTKIKQEACPIGKWSKWENK